MGLRDCRLYTVITPPSSVLHDTPNKVLLLNDNASSYEGLTSPVSVSGGFRTAEENLQPTPSKISVVVSAYERRSVLPVLHSMMLRMDFISCYGAIRIKILLFELVLIHITNWAFK